MISHEPLNEEEDPVVQEIPVYLCNEFLGSTTQLSLFHHPLRPPWRPYDYHKVKQLRMKPKAMRVEVDVPLETESRNYNEDIEDFKKVKTVTLKSQQVEAATSLALGTIQDGKFLLLPIDYSLQLRPALSHLNVGNTTRKPGKAGEQGASDDSDDEPAMRAVEVQVQKRETERQQQARLNSYAYLAQKEEEEPWVNLHLHSADSVPAESIWQRFVSPRETELASDVPKAAYLKACVPCISSKSEPAIPGPSNLGEQQQGSSEPYPASGTRPLGPTSSLSPPQLQAFSASIRALFGKHSVCTMANVRQWLQSDTTSQPSYREVAQLADRDLHDALMSSGLLVCIRRVYMLQSTNNTGSDPLRAIVLDLLKDKETFKRSEVFEIAHSKNITISETLYNRVVKDICQSRGYQWLLKNGADMGS
ncbi:hypothetical protein CEUSTIGMA_g8730.t1 [Chlamydomonas eustigma]|uniref:DNA-directed RNA polymerase III subunit RPC5 n=1 Tax=Chlamydomonas eustigma TaxID=1157962 RepID=A0A250XEF6_9CHLO|nr:hypothetical protein CEUSTIGMA_g8730.t1 [Chlamydomonas eustigma]|eukprot:GAX81299.1 hypothetical protein CEUSTIGMA_g8730.t1 [Chlamydomonas eustigma]